MIFLITTPLKRILIGPRHRLTEITRDVAIALFLEKNSDNNNNNKTCKIEKVTFVIELSQGLLSDLEINIFRLFMVTAEPG